MAKIYYSLYDRMLNEKGLLQAFAKVKSNKGSPGVDGQAIADFAEHLPEEIALLVHELRQKSRVVHSFTGVNYLGVEIHTGYTRIKREKVREFKDKVKRITRRNSPVNLKQVIADLNPVVRGFANYFRVANCQKEFKVLAQWIRRRLRAKQLCLWKRAKRLHRRLRQLGHQGEFTAIKMNSWRNSASNLASDAIPNSYLRGLGLFEMTSVQAGHLPQDFCQPVSARL